MAITINTDNLQNVTSQNALDVYRKHLDKAEKKQLANNDTLRESTIRNAAPGELKDFLSDIEKKVIADLFECNTDSNLPQFHSKSKLTSIGNRIDIKF